jgi:putative transposase
MTMGLHLAEIFQAIAPGAHAVVLLDQARGHTQPSWKVPANITLVPLLAQVAGTEPH